MHLVRQIGACVHLDKRSVGSDSSICCIKPTDKFLHVWLQLHGRVRFHDHLDENQAILLPCTDALHEPAPTHGFLIHQIRKLRHVDPCRPRRQGSEGVTLTHDGAWTASPLGDDRAKLEVRSLKTLRVRTTQRGINLHRFGNRLPVLGYLLHLIADAEQMIQ